MHEYRGVELPDKDIVDKLNELIGEGFEVVGLDYTTEADEEQRVYVVLQGPKLVCGDAIENGGVECH